MRRIRTGCWILMLSVAIAACGDDDVRADRTDGGRTDLGTATDLGVTTDLGVATDLGPLMCEASEQICDGVCVKTDTDEENCGACGNACATGESCTAGSCAPLACTGDEEICAGACANTMTDRTNCGSCGNACAAGETCTAGACASDCAAPRERCTIDTASVCLDTSSDSAHCGSCDTVCPAGQTCSGGACGCDGSRTACGATCVDTTTDRTNCGSCGRTCAASETCRDGGCRCAAGLTECAAGCVNVRTDNANCGTCATACPTGQSCSDGSCSSVCAAMPGTIFCAGACVNPSTSAAHCGGCGIACGAGTSCGGGTCRPVNDLRAGALPITLGAAEVTVTGSTLNSLRDGAGATCGCTGGAYGDVWYRFTLTTRDVVYFDTVAAGTAYDTGLYLADSAGATITTEGACNDDGYCSPMTRGSQIAARLLPGTYYVVVTGCSTGAFTLHGQTIPDSVASYLTPMPISGSAVRPDTLIGSSRRVPMCGGASGEDLLWFITCGGPQTASLCPSDGGSWTRGVAGGRFYDPTLSLFSASTGTEIMCNDDGFSGCGATDDPSSTLGARLAAVTAPRGLNAFIVDERNQPNGMEYQLHYSITR